MRGETLASQEQELRPGMGCCERANECSACDSQLCHCIAPGDACSRSVHAASGEDEIPMHVKSIQLFVP